MKKIVKIFLVVFLMFFITMTTTAIAEDAPQGFTVNRELALFNERIATDRMMNWVVDRAAERIIARLEKRVASQEQGPFVVRKDLADFNRQIEEKR